MILGNPQHVLILVSAAPTWPHMAADLYICDPFYVSQMHTTAQSVHLLLYCHSHMPLNSYIAPLLGEFLRSLESSSSTRWNSFVWLIVRVLSMQWLRCWWMCWIFTVKMMTMMTLQRLEVRVGEDGSGRWGRSSFICVLGQGWIEEGALGACAPPLA